MTASASAIKAGKAFVELFVDDNRLVRGLNLAADRVKAFGGHVRAIGAATAAIGAAALAPLIASVKLFATEGAAMDDMAKRTGISAQALTALGYAAEQSGSSLPTVEKGIKKMQQTIGDATDGMASATDALSALGTSAEELAGLSPDEQFMRLADSIAAIEDPTLRAARAQKVFGRSGTELLPLMEDGAAGIAALRAEAERLGLVLSETDVAKAAELDDALARIGSQVKGTLLQVGAALAEPAIAAAKAVSALLERITAWVKENRGLVVSIAKIAAVVAVAGGAILGLGIGIQVIGFALGGLAIVAGLAAKAFTVMWTALTGPVGLAVAAVVGIGAVLLTQTETGRAALGKLGSGFAQVKDDALAAFGGIRDALASGDIGQAARIVWSLVKLEWARGVNAIREAMLPVKYFATDAFWGMAAAANNAWASIESGWLATTSFLSQAWTRFTGALSAGWNVTMGFLEKSWTRLKGLFDEGVDVEAEVARIDARVAAANRAQVAETNAALAAAADRRAARAGQIERDRQAGLLGAGQAAVDARGRHNQSVSDAARDLQAATAEFRRSITEARQHRTTYEAELARKQADDAAATASGASARGLFNFAHLRALQNGGGSVQERIARAAEETARNTRKREALVGA